MLPSPSARLLLLLAISVSLAQTDTDTRIKFNDFDEYSRQSFLYGPTFKLGDFESRIWTRLGPKSSTGNLESNQDLSKLLYYSESQLETYLRREHYHYNKPEYFKFIDTLNNFIIRVREWIWAYQAYFVPNVFSYDDFRHFKPHLPGYFSYMSQKSCFYSLLAKFILILSLWTGLEKLTD